MAGLTLDTGALISLERRRQRMSAVFKIAQEEGRVVTVPTVAVAEWWRGRTDFSEDLLAAVKLEALTPQLAKLAGEAMVHVPGATVNDAIVMASAAQRGDVVYTSDFDDLEALRRVFPGVRVLGV